MGAERAGVSGEQKPANDAPVPAQPSRDPAAPAPATAPAPAGPAPASTPAPASAPTSAAGGSLGDRQVQAKAASDRSVVGDADAPEERAADDSADHVMRMPFPEKDGPAEKDPQQALPAPDATRNPEVEPETVRRQASSEAANGRLPAVTPAGPAPLVAAPASTAPDAGGSAPTAEPPAPEGEQPARTAPMVPEDVQAYLDASRGQGSPLPDEARTTFEAKFQRSFDDVTIHDDGGADDAARRIDALAFTRGSDIYFRAGAYDPTSEAGQRLLAHELAHVVQQRPGINRSIVRRGIPKAGSKKSDDPGDKKDVVDVADPKGTIDISNPKAKTLKLAKVKVPQFKATFKPTPIRWRRANEARTNKQRELWLADSTNKTDALTSVKSRIQTLGLPAAGPHQLQGKAAKKSAFLYVGMPEEIADALVIPPWNRSGKFAQWEVDHKAEWQIGGEDEKVTNYWLLDPSINSKSGNFVKNSIKDQLDKFLTEANKTLTKKQSRGSLKGASWTVTWDDVEGVAGVEPTDDKKFDRSEIKDAAWQAGLEKYTGEAEDIKGAADKLVIYPHAGGGQVKRVDIDATSGEGKYARKIGKSKLQTVKWEQPGTPAGGSGKRVGVVSGDVFERGSTTKVKKDVLEVPILSMTGVDYGGHLDKEAVKGERNRLLEAGFASPIEFSDLEFDLDRGLSGRGKIPTPSVKLLERASIFVILENGKVGFEATITGDEVKLPGPFKITGGALTLQAIPGEDLSIEGSIDFEIEKLAKGSIAARTGLRSGFELEGELEFDTKMFDKARLGLTYKDGKWGATGELAVGEGKITGIKRASAKVAVDDEAVTADGEFETSIKGVTKGKLGFKYDPATGMEITGMIELGQMPGIKSGKLDAKVKQGAQGWTLAGGVTIEPSIPGVAASITGRYEDGAFDVAATIAYARGIAAGQLTLGVTNAAVGDDGKPSGPPRPDGQLTPYGEGRVTLKFTEWLQGTVGLKLKPNGEIEVSGEVALAQEYTVFPEKRIDKTLLSIGIDIPIVGVAVAGQRIGIFATIKGSVSIGAGFGPGTLRELALRVTYNPDRPDDTTVTGTGTFVVPAAAGLRLSVDGGLGAGIPIVSATAGISVYGELGLAGAASASAQVAWSPRTGVVLDARGDVSVQPKFKFGVDAFVDVSADLLVTTIELYHQKWKLAAFEYGSDLTFGVTFPIHYESGKPFQPSFDDMQWKYPDINPSDVLGGLMKQLVG